MASPYISHPIALADVLANEGGITFDDLMARKAELALTL